MAGGFNQLPGFQAVFRWLLNVFLIAGLAACQIPEIFPPQSSPNFIPCTPVPITYTPITGTPTVNVTPTEINVNIYKTPPNPLIIDMFQHGATPVPSFTPMPLTPTATPDFFLPTKMAMDQEERTLETKNAAIEHLVYEVERWTNVQEIDFDENSRAYIMVTFISPELVQSIFLNNLLRMQGKSTANIWIDLNSVLSQFSKREEMTFMVTIMIKNDSVVQSPHKLEIDTTKMMLVNADHLSIPPQHGDQNLDHPIDLSSEPVFGYLYYPFAVMSDNSCKQVLDPKYNTKIVIQTEAIKVDSAPTYLTWTIPYKPLLETGMSMYTPEYVTPEPTSIATMPIIKDGPPGLTPINWEEFAEFIRKQITLDIN